MSVRIAGIEDINRYSGPLEFIGRDLEGLVARINAALSRVEPKVTQFMPRITGTTLGGVGTYTSQAGWCVKTGPWVMVTGQVAWNAHTGTGNMRIAGLPHRTSAEIQTKSAAYRGACALVGNGLTFSDQLVGRLLGDTDEIQVSSISSGGAPAETAMDTSAAVNFTAVYLTDEDS